MNYKINHANIKDWAKNYDGELFDGILCDPPYELGFMGKSWDSSGIAFDTEMWADIYKLLKPGAHLLAFSGSRTYHRMAVAIEDAGFEIRDMMSYIYGSGFPKSLNIQKQMEKKVNERTKQNTEHKLRPMPDTDIPQTLSTGSEAELVLQPSVSQQGIHGTMQGQKPSQSTQTREEPSMERRSNTQKTKGELQRCPLCEMPTELLTDGTKRRIHNGTQVSNGSTLEQNANENRSGASHRPQSKQQSHIEFDAICNECITQTIRRLSGMGTALKPAVEPICLARKPLDGTVLENVLKHGTGGLNIDGTRVGTETMTEGRAKQNTDGRYAWNTGVDTSKPLDNPQVHTGRFPANLIIDGSDEVEAVFPQTGKGNGGKPFSYSGREYDNKDSSMFNGDKPQAPSNFNDSGSASRFFYTAKASKSERNAGLDSTVSIRVQLEICENNITRQENLAQLQVVMDNSHLKATAESGIGTKSGTEWSMSLFGNQYTEKYPINTKSTTKTTTSSTTTSVILNWLIGLLTNESTLGVNLEMASGGSLVESAESSNTLIATINDQTALALGVNPAQANKRLLISVSDGKNFHSTVKPLSLTKYLATLIKPPTGGRLLVPFSGSGSEMIGALQAGWEYVEGVELTEEYIPIAKARIEYWTNKIEDETKQMELV